MLPAARQLAAEDPYWRRIYPSSEEQFQTLRYYPYDAYFANWDHITTIWDREILRNG